MNKEILRIALPAIIANITVPLLGLIDLTIAGHLGDAAFIGAMSVAATMFNLVYWNFGFLRMGTSGLTAQAYGRGDSADSVRVLLRATTLGAAIGAAIVLLQYPLQWITLWAIGPSDDVLALARRYFYVCVWGAPAILTMMGIKGWFLGMQDSRSPMMISIGVNVVNILVSLVAVYVFRLGFLGIAIGTVTAEWMGLAFSVWLLLHKHRATIAAHFSWGDVLVVKELRKFMSVNADIFLRSLCLMFVTLFFISVGARSGDMILAVNALIMQLFVLYSYFMDGIAFAGEALVGKYFGAHDAVKQNRCVARLFAWGSAIMMLFVLAYSAGLQPILSLLTDEATVVSTAMQYRWWCVAIPVAGMAAFVWDGVFIGLTRTRAMLLSIAISAAAYFGIYLLWPGTPTNDHLWCAFIAYLAIRGAVLTVAYLQGNNMKN